MHHQPFLSSDQSHYQNDGYTADLIEDQRLAGQFTLNTFRIELLQHAQRRDAAAARQTIMTMRQSFSPSALDEAYALHTAAWMPELNDLAISLLKSGCNPYCTDYNGDSVMHYAVKGCNLDFLKAIRDNHGNKIFFVLNNRHFNLALAAAAEAPDDNPTVLLLMLEWMYLVGCSFEIQDATGKTPLCWAAQRGSITLVQYFLAKGVNLAHRDHNGHTVLHLACSTGDEETVLFLCDKGAINLLGAESNDEAGVNTAVKVCLRRGYLFLAMSLGKWFLQHKTINTVKIFRTMYAWYFSFVMSLNLGVNLWIGYVLTQSTTKRWWSIPGVYLLLWCLTQLTWIIGFASDPGYVKKSPISSQFHRCSKDFTKDSEKAPVNSARPTSYLHKLFILEKEMLKLNLKFIDLNKSYGNTRKHATNLPHVGKLFDDCARQIGEIRHKMHGIMANVAEERRALCPRGYAMAISKGKSKKVCMTCGLMKAPRSHHCSDCAACISRFDHHCIWLDNCVGKGNQRTFFFFLVFINLSIFYGWGLYIYYYLTAEYNKVGFVQSLKNPLTFVGFFNSVLNFGWLTFLSYLLFRTFKSMCSNVTFYESYRRPAHIENRFNGNFNRCCWEMSDVSLGRFCRNIYSYFSLDERFDKYDYPEFYGGKATKNSAVIEMSKPPETPTHQYSRVPTSLQHGYTRVAQS